MSPFLMLESLKKSNQIIYRQQRRAINLLNKIAKAKARKQAVIALGKTVIVSEVDGVKTYSFPPPIQPPTPTLPCLTWLSGKSFRQHFGSRKNQSGTASEHRAALVEDASRIFAKEVEKAAILPVTSPAPEVAEITQ